MRVCLTFCKESAIKKRGKKKRRVETGKFNIPDTNCWNACQVFLLLPFNVDVEDVYAQPNAWNQRKSEGNNTCMMKRLCFNMLCFPEVFQQIMTWSAFPVIIETLGTRNMTSQLLTKSLRNCFKPSQESYGQWPLSITKMSRKSQRLWKRSYLATSQTYDIKQIRISTPMKLTDPTGNVMVDLMVKKYFDK